MHALLGLFTISESPENEMEFLELLWKACGTVHKIFLPGYTVLKAILTNTEDKCVNIKKFIFYTFSKKVYPHYSVI